uniref:Uncharacterized protein n=1 Tax=Oryza barthii TaxID=65489 RepID=A0A0D3HVV4_9ORYZ
MANKLQLAIAFVVVVVVLGAMAASAAAAVAPMLTMHNLCPYTRVYGGDTGGDVVACRGPASYFKLRCPLTRTGGGDVEPVPQHCISPGEIKLVFCQAAMVAGEPELIRTVDVADN